MIEDDLIWETLLYLVKNTIRGFPDSERELLIDKLKQKLRGGE